MAPEPPVSTPTKKEALFDRLATLSDADDQVVVDKGRLASEAFLKGAKKIVPKSSTALPRGSSRSTSSRKRRQVEVGQSNGGNCPPVAREGTPTASAPEATSLMYHSGADGNTKKQRKELLASNPPTTSMNVNTATSASLQAFNPAEMSSSAVLKSAAKRKRVQETPLAPEALRIFSGLSFCTLDICNRNRNMKK